MTIERGLAPIRRTAEEVDPIGTFGEAAAAHAVRDLKCGTVGEVFLGEAAPAGLVAQAVEETPQNSESCFREPVTSSKSWPSSASTGSATARSWRST